MQRPFAAVVLIVGLAATPVAVSHLDNTAFHLSYRQSLYALLGANFGPMSSMIKGEIPWDDEAFQGYARDLATAASLDMPRGFPPGSHSGRTRARPAVWERPEDFAGKAAALAEESAKLALVAASGDRRAILRQFQKTGGACKSCHDDYKSKDYLN